MKNKQQQPKPQQKQPNFDAQEIKDLKAAKKKQLQTNETIRKNVKDNHRD